MQKKDVEMATMTSVMIARKRTKMLLSLVIENDPKVGISWKSRASARNAVSRSKIIKTPRTIMDHEHTSAVIKSPR